MGLAYLNVIVLLHAAFAGVFFFLNREQPSRFARLFSWSWAIEAVRAAILLPGVHDLAGAAHHWYALADVLCPIANWCLFAGCADLVAARLPRWLAPAYFWSSIPLVLLGRYGLPSFLEVWFGLPPGRGGFYGVLANMVVLFVPVAACRVAIMVWLFRLWRNTRLPGALLAAGFCVPYAVVAVAVPFQFYHGYNPDWLVFAWCARVLGFSIGLVLLMLSQQRAALRASEASLAEAQSIARIGRWEFDVPTGRFTWSAEMYRLKGRDPAAGPPGLAELLGAIHPDDQPALQSRAARVQAGGATQPAEFRIRRDDGGFRWIVCDAVSSFDAKGRLVRRSGTAQDITERKQAEIRIQHLNRVYALLSDVNQTIVRERDPEAMLSAACRIAVDTGRLRMAWIGLTDQAEGWLRIAAHAGADEEALKLLDALIGTRAQHCGCAFTQGAATTGDHRVCNDVARDPLAASWRAEALARNCRALASLPLKTEGTVIGTFNLYSDEAGFFDEEELRLLDELAMDISFALEVSRKESEHRLAEEALQQSEKRYRTLVQGIQAGVVVHGPDGRITACNVRATELLGLSESQMLGRVAVSGEWKRVRPDGSPLQTGEFPVNRSLATGRPVRNVVLGIHRPAQGDLIWALVNADPVFDPTGGILEVIVTFMDITEQRKLEEKLRQSQKMDAIGQLSGGVAHDFNNILTVIQGNISLLETDEACGPSQRESLAEIAQAAERAANLTRQLLTFSRRQAMQPRDLDLNEVVVNTTRMLQRILGEDIRMQVVYASKPLFFHADPSMMDQILLNLVVNSRDAMPTGGRLVIETGLVEIDEQTAAQNPQSRPGSFVCLSVSDSGGGIPADILPNIFEPFFTTKDVGKGTGLGLATVYGIVQQHQGWIGVASEPGHGTTFRIHFPKSARAADLAPGTAGNNPSRRGDETILVVEDEPSVRILVRNILSRLGYRILEASNGAGALDVWRRNRADIRLLLTDLVMPDGISGLDLAGQLLKENPDLKVVYTSGYSAEIASRGFPMDEGVNFIAKPYRPKTLGDTIRSALDGRSSKYDGTDRLIEPGASPALRRS
jgi:PAS domain S-box-containing protein